MTADEPTIEARLAELERRRDEALAMGGREKIARHRESGRLTVRERITALVDRDSFFEIGLLAQPERLSGRPAPADAIVTGLARIDGRKVAVLGIDATVKAGTTAPVNMRKQGRLEELAGRRGLPIIALSDADGGRIPDVIGWRFSGLPFDFRTFVQPPAGSPAVPRLTAILGPSFGDAALHAAAAHFVVMKRDGALGLSGPPVIEGAIGEKVTPTELGGPDVVTASGYVHQVVDGEEEVLAALRGFLSYLPSNAGLSPPSIPGRLPARPPEELLTIVPTRRKRGYDVRHVLEAIFDEGSIFPWGERTGRSLVTSLARLDGETVGVVANQPLFLAGVLDPAALAKEHAFAGLCDTFNIPMVFLHDVPGLMIGTKAEREGVLAWYERVVSRLARATVPKLTVIMRKSYGGGNFAMAGRPTHPDLLVCWPTAELGFMAPETGVRTLHRRRLEDLLVSDGPEAHAALIEKLAEEWSHESEPWEAAAHVYVDDIIRPQDTRRVLIAGLDYAWGTGRRPPPDAGSPSR
ncbi:MAG: acyl-CoA carboxylase subunit beta [Acidimicrobiales bacterium]